MRLCVLLPLLALGACTSRSEAEPGPTSSGPGERSFDVGKFESVALGGRHNVVVKVGGPHSVRAEGPEEVLDRLDITVSGGTLQIRDQRRGWSLGDRPAATVYVTAPTIEGAAIGGSGNINIDKVSGARFAGSIGGSGNIAVDRIKVGQATFSVAGSGNLKVAGAADGLKVSVVGSGDVDAAKLAARTAHISVAGSGDAAVQASESAFVSIAGSGDVTVDGTARCSVSKLGSGNVHCRG
jgi:hypothetical protein